MSDSPLALSALAAAVDHVHWGAILAWTSLAVGSAIARRIGFIIRLLSLLYAPVALLLAVWLWGRYGLGVIGLSWLVAGLFTMGLMLLSLPGILARGLPPLSARRVLSGLLTGPLGLAGSLHNFIASFAPQPAPGHGLLKKILAGNAGPRLAETCADETVDGSTQRIESDFQALWQKPYQAVRIDPAQFDHLDRAFYDDFRMALGHFGFTHAGDIEIVSLRVPNVKPTFVRVMISHDHYVMASCHHVKLPPELESMASNLETKSIEFESEFTDGSFVVTTSQAAAMHFDYGDQINAQCLEGFSFAELGQHHYERLAIHGKVRRVGLVSIQSLDDVNASQARLHASRAASRGLQGLSRDEFRRAAGTGSDEADGLYDTWQASRQLAAAGA